MNTSTNAFSNEKITVTYSPRCCTNAGLCARQLSNVFRHSVIPWIDLNGEKTEKIIEQIKKCPSGALNYYFNHKDSA
ncbi:(4Fe-4S)-binding protein [Winogradskyella ursingii]|uniref:(4Fe-4S)-binding protein n=1 Tax=Winogradskyella ursingii TaxID=2686079 RepID=UPI0015C722DB|nr:(4Fe-4S)-binding protein [Winogradskyella ursingii]